MVSWWWVSAILYQTMSLIDLGQRANEENAITSGANKYAETSLPDMNIDIEDIEKMIAQQDQDFFNN